MRGSGGPRSKTNKRLYLHSCNDCKLRRSSLAGGPGSYIVHDLASEENTACLILTANNKATAVVGSVAPLGLLELPYLESRIVVGVAHGHATSYCDLPNQIVRHPCPSGSSWGNQVILSCLANDGHKMSQVGSSPCHPKHLDCASQFTLKRLPLARTWQPIHCHTTFEWTAPASTVPELLAVPVLVPRPRTVKALKAL